MKAGCSPSYQLARFAVVHRPEPRPAGRGVQHHPGAHRDRATAGCSGTGLFHGPQTNGGFVPEQQTDFVFSVAGEEFGLVGGGGDHRAVRGAAAGAGCASPRDADPAGRLVAVGIVCWFAFQAFQNIGMNLGLTPVTGVPLPFVSYGGSSMFAEGLAIGLLAGRAPPSAPADGRVGSVGRLLGRLGGSASPDGASRRWCRCWPAPP